MGKLAGGFAAWCGWAALVGGCVPYPGPLGSLGRPVDPAPHPLFPALSVPAAPRPPSSFQAAVVESARYYLQNRPPGERDDCSSFVIAVYERAGWPTEGSTTSLYQALHDGGDLHRRRTPRPGDLVFFDNTYDRNHNGRLDDELSHIGVVVSVERDGTFEVAHGGTSKGRTTMRMNLRFPDQVKDEAGRVINDPLRARKPDDPPRTQYMASELWRTFATIPAGAVR